MAIDIEDVTGERMVQSPRMAGKGWIGCFKLWVWVTTFAHPPPLDITQPRQLWERSELEKIEALAMRSASSNSFVSRIWYKQVPPKRCVALWPWWTYLLSIFKIKRQWTNGTRIWCNIVPHLSMLGFCPLLQEKPLGPKAFGLGASPRKQFEVDWRRVHRINMKMAVSIWLFLKKPTKIHPLLILIRSSCPFWGCGWGLLRHSSGLCQKCSLDRITADPGTLWKQIWNSLQ